MPSRTRNGRHLTERRTRDRKCYYCGKGYFRRNLVIVWTFTGGRYTNKEVRSCLNCKGFAGLTASYLRRVV